MWDPPPELQQNGELTEYKVRFAMSESEVGVQEARLVTVEASQTSVVLMDLDTWTQYKIWVAASTSAGDGPYSDVIVVQTDEDGRS